MKKCFENKKKMIVLVALSLFCTLFIGCKSLDAKFFENNGRFILLGETLNPREGSSAVVLNNGQILITGGASNTINLDISKSAELFNPKNRKFTKTGNLNVGRSSHRSILLNDGRVLIIGGFVQYKNRYGSTKIAEIYNPTTGIFTKLEMLNSYQIVNLILLNDGRVLVAPSIVGRELEIFDPKINQFKKAGVCLTERCPENAIKLNDGTVLFINGYQDRNDKITRRPQIYNPTNGLFKYVDEMLFSRSWSTATLLKNGEVLIIGGKALRKGHIKNAEIYNPKTGTFRLSSELNQPRSWHSSILLSNGKVLVVGGKTGSDISLRDLKSVELYDPQTDKFIKAGNSHFTRSEPELVKLKDGSVFIVGGGSFVKLPYTTTSRRPELYISK